MKVTVQSPFPNTQLQMSGHITVTTAGTAVQGPDIGLENGIFFKAHPDNTGVIWVGHDGAGDVSSANGFPIEPGETIIILVSNLNQLWFDSSVNGEKVCWLRA